VIQALLEHGASSIAIFDFDPAQGKKAVEELKGRYADREFTFERVDVTDGEAVERATERVAETFGKVDLLLCFAGIVDCQHAIDMTHAKWRRMLDVNATGPFICAQAAARSVYSEIRRRWKCVRVRRANVVCSDR
jgi:sorbose reductase